MSFHPLGLTRFVNCNITISDGTLTVGNEVAECSQIEIGGITTTVKWKTDEGILLLINGKVLVDKEYTTK